MQAQLALLGLGANLGDGAAALRAAALALAALPGCQLVAASSLWRSAPVDAGGPDYWNAVLALRCGGTPEQLLQHMQAIELEFGRQRPAGVHNAPRTLDLDLLFFGQLARSSPQLTLPHPRWRERAFVLAPLLEISPGFGSEQGLELEVELRRLVDSGQALQRVGPLLG